MYKGTEDGFKIGAEVNPGGSIMCVRRERMSLERLLINE